MEDDYNHRWTFIRKATKGIYIFFKILLYEIPRFLFIDGAWEIIKATSRGAVRLYDAIPPVKEWPGIISRAIISMVKGIGRFLVALGKGIVATPKVIYKTGKYIVKHTWKGIKAIPRLVKVGAEKAWSGVKIIATWLKDFFLRFHSFVLTCLYECFIVSTYSCLRDRGFLPLYYPSRYYQRIQENPPWNFH